MLGLLMVGCGPKEAAPGDTEPMGSTGGGGSSSSATPTTSGGTSAGISGEVTSEASAATTASSGTSGEASGTGSTWASDTDTPVDLPPTDRWCDPMTVPSPDCPAGYKCTIDGGTNGETHCVPVVEEPVGLGETCHVTMGSWVDGYDDCDAGLLCWDVDEQTGEGSCIPFCQGTPDEPTCPEAMICTICQTCVPLCLPTCHPLKPDDCEADELCIPVPQDPEAWTCAPDASGPEGQVFDPCEYPNACDPGLGCFQPWYAAECDEMSVGCCLPYCDTTMMAACPGVGQECLPWYEMGTAPAGFEDVGICGVPQ